MRSNSLIELRIRWWSRGTRRARNPFMERSSGRKRSPLPLCICLCIWRTAAATSPPILLCQYVELLRGTKQLECNFKMYRAHCKAGTIHLTQTGSINQGLYLSGIFMRKRINHESKVLRSKGFALDGSIQVS